MSALLKILGTFFLTRLVISQAGQSVISKITYNFRTIKVNKFSLSKTVLQFSFVVSNGSQIPIVIEQVGGLLSFGAVRAGFNVDQILEIQPGDTGILNFTIGVQNGDFLIGLSDLLQASRLPKLNFNGYARVGLNGDKTVRVPINQNIPISI